MTGAVEADDSTASGWRYEVYLGYEDHEYGTGLFDADEEDEYFEVVVDERDRGAAIREAKDRAEYAVSHVEGTSEVGRAEA